LTPPENSGEIHEAIPGDVAKGNLDSLCSTDHPHEATLGDVGKVIYHDIRELLHGGVVEVNSHDTREATPGDVEET